MTTASDLQLRREKADARRIKVAELLDSGMSAADIAEKLDVSLSTIRDDRRKLGRTPTQRIDFTPEQLRLVDNLIADKCPPGEIAATLGVHQSTVRRLWPQTRMTSKERTEWLSIRSSITRMIARHDGGDALSW